MALAAAALTLAIAVSASPAEAAVPPPCVPTGLKTTDVLPHVIAWSGFRPVKKWRQLQVRLDPCKASGDTARLFVTVAPPARARHGVAYEGELILSVTLADKKPLNSAAHRGQVSRLARSLPKTARAAEADGQVVAWLTEQRRQGRQLAARMDDMGGHGPPCLDYAASAEGAPETVLRWCAESGLERFTLVAPQTSKRPEIKALLAFVAKTRPGCKIDRLQMRPSGKTWQATARLAGKADCARRFRASTDAGGRWKAPKARGGHGRSR